MMRILNVKDTAIWLSVCEKTVRKLIKEGELKAAQINRNYRVTEEDLIMFINLKKVNK